MDLFETGSQQELAYLQESAKLQVMVSNTRQLTIIQEVLGTDAGVGEKSDKQQQGVS